MDSAVALYSAAALMLVGAVAGGKLGMKTVEVGEKVARNQGDEVVQEAEERAGRDLPELVWDEVRRTDSCVLSVEMCCTHTCTRTG